MTGILDIQFTPKIGDKAANLNVVKGFIEQNSDKQLDLVVMPEFFSTGISHDAFEKFPEDENGGQTIEFLSNLAKKYHTNIVCGTVIEKIGNNFYNTAFVLNRSGEIVAKYSKIHLFNYTGGNEGELITPGDKAIVADLDFGKVGLAVCFDMRYSQYIRKLAQMGAELVVLPTSWVIPNNIYNDNKSKQYEREMWLAMNRTRAYDNMAYVVVSNEVGRANDNVSNLGSSLIISPKGEILSDAKDAQIALYSKIDLEVVRNMRAQYPIISID